MKIRIKLLCTLASLLLPVSVLAQSVVGPLSPASVRVQPTNRLYRHAALPNTPPSNQSVETSTSGPTNPVAEKLFHQAEQEQKNHLYCAALADVQRALIISPSNLDYLFLLADLADYLHKYCLEQDAYERLLAIDPKNADGLIGLASTYASLYHFEKAKAVFEMLKCKFPKNKQVWLQYADMEDTRNEYLNVFPLMNEYRCRFGADLDYWKRMARYLVDAGRYNSSMIINSGLLAENPKDPYILTTKVLDLDAANCKCGALGALDQLMYVDPFYGENLGAMKIVLTPIRSNITFAPSYYTSTAPVRITDVPLGMQFFINPRTSIIFRGLYEYLTTTDDPDSDLRTIDGHSSIDDSSYLVGFTRSGCFWNFELAAGNLFIDDYTTHIYRVYANYLFNERFSAELRHYRDLYRPYEYSNSPRSVSLNILEYATSVTFFWEPCLEHHLDVLVKRGDLTDGNSYWRFLATPYKRVLTYENINIDLGLNIDNLMFASDRGEFNGYFSPKYYGLYQGTMNIYVLQSENTNYNIYLALGREKDTETPGSRIEFDAGVAATFGVFCDWQLILKAEHVSQWGPASFHDLYVKAQITRRL